MQIQQIRLRLPTAAVFLAAGLLTGLAQAADMDGDGIADSSDNCSQFANPMQLDGDQDGMGNRCDPDFNNDGIVDALDLDYLKSVFFESDMLGDLDASGSVEFNDLAILKTYFGSPAGAPPPVSGRRGGINAGIADGIISLQPETTGVFLDDLLTLEVHMDFTADPTIGGGFDILYDDNLLQFESWEAADLGDPAFQRPPDVEPGVLKGFAIGDFDGISGPALVGTLTFSARMLGQTEVESSATAFVPVGPFVSATDFMAQEVEFFSAQVEIALEPGPRILVEPNLVDFAPVIVGEASNSRVTVTNIGDQDLFVGMIGEVDSLAPPFSVAADNCSAQTLPPAADCTIDLVFAPESFNTFVDSFDIPSNAVNATTFSVLVQGSPDSSVAPNIGVTPPALLFTDVPIGGSQQRAITIWNSGVLALEIGVLGDSEALETPFAIQSDPCSNAVIEPGEFCRFVVRYSPTVPEASSDALNIPSNDPDTPNSQVQFGGRVSPSVETDVFGNVSGVATPAIAIVCHNGTTGQTVTGFAPTITGWNCRALGLEATEGDTVEVFLRGAAE